MKLDVTVDVPGEDNQRSVTVDLMAVEPEDTQRAIDLLGGPEPLSDLARGEWNPDGAQALLFVALARELAADGVELDPNHTAIDFGDLSGLFADLDPELEASIPMEADG